MKEIRLDTEGQMVITKFMSQFDLDGYVTDIKVRQFKPTDDTVTYGVKLRGYTSGNIDLEIPLVLDMETGKLGEPVVGFIEGQAVLLSQGLFDRVLGEYNFKQEYYPGWTQLDKQWGVGEFFRYNDPEASVGKTKFSSRDIGRAGSGFFVARSGSLDSVDKAVKAYVLSSKFSNVTLEDLLDGICLAFGNRYGFVGLPGQLVRLAQDDDEFDEVIGDYPPLESIPSRERPSEEVEIDNELDQYPFPEDSPLDLLEEEPLIEIPSVYETITFPELDDLLQVIRLFRVIRFTYRKLNEEWVMRSIEPHYAWLTKKGNIIIIGYDYYRGDWRAFDLGRIRDVDVLQKGEWMELGQFQAMLENAKGKGLELVDMKESFMPRGPYHDVMVTVRGNLQRMNKKFEGPMKELVNNIIDTVGDLIHD